jgi:hypothetical protein
VDENRFRRLFKDAIGEAPVPPDLSAGARRALERPVRRTSRTPEFLAAVAAVVLIAATLVFNLVSHRAHPPATAPGSSSVTTPTAIPTAAPLQACTADRLSMAAGRSQGAAGHLFQELNLTNTSAAPCSIDGYPGAQLLSSGGAPVPTRVVDRGGMLANTPPPSSFVLLPGQRAAFQVSWGDVPVGGEACQPASAIEVGPPGEAPNPALELKGLSITICNSGELDATGLAPSA